MSGSYEKKCERCGAKMEMCWLGTPGVWLAMSPLGRFMEVDDRGPVRGFSVRDGREVRGNLLTAGVSREAVQAMRDRGANVVWVRVKHECQGSAVREQGSAAPQMTNA